MPATTSASASSERAVQTTFIPTEARCSAIAWPMPRDAPVTSATFPARSTAGPGETNVEPAVDARADPYADSKAADETTASGAVSGNASVVVTVVVTPDTAADVIVVVTVGIFGISGVR